MLSATNEGIDIPQGMPENPPTGPGEVQQEGGAEQKGASMVDTVREGALAATVKVRDVSLQVLEDTKTSINNGMATLRRPPELVVCLGCRSQLPCPPDLFRSWTCKNGHQVSLDEHPSGHCPVEGCGDEKPADYIHSLRCLGCGHITPVDTKLVQWVKGAGGKVAAVTTSAVKETIRTSKFMLAQPTTFHCKSCNAELHNPIVALPSWRCQVCNCDNARETEACTRCKYKRSGQRVICGVCNKSTPVPTRNISNLVTRGANDIAKGATKVFYNISQQAWVSCPRCRNPCTVHKEVIKQVREGKYAQESVYSVCKKCHVQFAAGLSTVKGISLYETLESKLSGNTNTGNGPSDVEEETTTMAEFMSASDDDVPLEGKAAREEPSDDSEPEPVVQTEPVSVQQESQPEHEPEQPGAATEKEGKNTHENGDEKEELSAVTSEDMDSPTPASGI
jgi:hypothetical protein